MGLCLDGARRWCRPPSELTQLLDCQSRRVRGVGTEARGVGRDLELVPVLPTPTQPYHRDVQNSNCLYTLG